MPHSIGPFKGLLYSSPFMTFYLLQYKKLADETTWCGYLMLGALICTLFMFTRIVRLGEVARLTFFHGDTGSDYGPGVYFPANAFPFLQEIKLQLGFHLEIIQHLYRGATPAVYHHLDTRNMTTRVNVNTDSFLKANLNRVSNSLFEKIFTFYGDNHEIEYWRVGRIGFLFLILAALLGRVVAPSHAMHDEQVTSTYSGTVTDQSSNIRTSKTMVLAQLIKGPQPVFPSDEHFSVGNEWTSFLIRGRKYVHYKESDTGEPPAIRSDNTECFIVPAGRKIAIYSSRPPVFVVNMLPDVTYYQQYEYGAFWKRTLVDAAWTLSKKDGRVKTNHLRKEDTWETLRSEWNTVQPDTPLVAMAIPLGKIIDGRRGGLICF